MGHELIHVHGGHKELLLQCCPDCHQDAESARTASSGSRTLREDVMPSPLFLCYDFPTLFMLIQKINVSSRGSQNVIAIFTQI